MTPSNQLNPKAMGLQLISDTPFAVVDLESTGFIPGFDRVVEVAVVRIDPGEEPRLVFETLVNPRRKMSMTELHGVTEKDVANAPRFEAIAGDLLGVLSSCCVVAYNANFDTRMLRWEFEQVGVDFKVPYICLQNIRSALEIGSGALEDACLDHNVSFYAGHFAAYDALSEAALLLKLLPVFEAKGIEKFGHFLDLQKKSYKYLESLVLPTLSAEAHLGSEVSGNCVPRHRDSDEVPDTRRALGRYSDALVAVVGDGVVTDDEVVELAKLRKRFAFRPAEVRSLHARIFAQFIALYADDRWLDDSEAETLHTLHKCLGELGWAPGNDIGLAHSNK